MKRHEHESKDEYTLSEGEEQPTFNPGSTAVIVDGESLICLFKCKLFVHLLYIMYQSNVPISRGTTINEWLKGSSS